MRVSEWGRVVFEFHFLLREGEGQLYTYYDYRRKKKSRKYPSLVLRIYTVAEIPINQYFILRYGSRVVDKLNVFFFCYLSTGRHPCLLVILRRCRYFISIKGLG